MLTYDQFKELHARMVSKGKIRANGQDYPLQPLDALGIEIFYSEFHSMFANTNLGSVTASIFSHRIEACLGFIMHTCSKLKGEFRGTFASGSEIGWGWLRPESIDETVWSQTISASGWQDYWGSSSSPKTLNDESAIIILGLSNEAENPLVDEVKFTVVGKEASVLRLDEIKYGDNMNNVPVQPSPTIIVIEKQKFHMRSYNNASSGTDRLRMIGLVAGTGTYLGTEAPS